MGIHDLAFKIIRNKTKKLTLLKAAGYILMLAVCTKLVCFVEAGHPAIEKLMSVQGVVREVKIGGEGSSTYLKIESQQGTHRYSSYYGKDWPVWNTSGPVTELACLWKRTGSIRTSCSAVNNITFGNLSIRMK
jgi:hypothetical protein